MIPDSKLTWFSFNPSEFLIRTVGLSNSDVGAYIKLLAYSWVNGPLPNNPKVLTSIAGKGNMELITTRFFEVNGDGKLCDPRLEASRIEATKILEANRKRTAKASETRWKDSPSRMRDDSATATEDNDKDNDKDKGQSQDSDKGQLPDKGQVDDKTGNRSDAGDTLHKEPSPDSLTPQGTPIQSAGDQRETVQSAPPPVPLTPSPVRRTAPKYSSYQSGPEFDPCATPAEERIYESA